MKISGSTHYQSSMHGENPDILTNAEVDKTIFDSSRGSPEAVGIQYS